MKFYPSVIVPIDSVSEYKRNYNSHPPSQVDQLDGSLDDFGQFKNIVIWNGQVIAGNGLLKAARQRGETEIEVKDYSHLSEEQAKSLLIADNALPFGALPDTAALERLLEDLKDVDIPGVTQDWLASVNINLDLEIDDVHAEVDGQEGQENKLNQCPKCGFTWQK